jgi:hypothetical protein
MVAVAMVPGLTWETSITTSSAFFTAGAEFEVVIKTGKYGRDVLATLTEADGITWVSETEVLLTFNVPQNFSAVEDVYLVFYADDVAMGLAITVDVTNGSSTEAGAIDITIDSGEILVDVEVTGGTSDSIYELAMFAGGTLTAGELVFQHIVSRPFTLPSGLTNSRFYAGVAADAEAELSIQKNGVEFATATVAAAGTSATFACLAATSFVAGDRLEVYGPTPADADLADVSMTLRATKD